MMSERDIYRIGELAKMKIFDLEIEINDATKYLGSVASLRHERALYLIESRIDNIALLASLTYVVNNLAKITNNLSERKIIVEAELIEYEVRSREISKELIRLTKLKRTSKYLLLDELEHKDKLIEKQKEIKYEQNEKKFENVLLAGEGLEAELLNTIQESQNYSKLVIENAKLLKLEKQLFDLRELNQTRSSVYLNLKSEYINTIGEVERLRYIDEHIKEAKNQADETVIMISADIEGLTAKQKATVSEIHRIYGYKSMTNLNEHESLKLDNYDKQKNQLDEKIQKKKIELASFIGKQQEENYISQKTASNPLEQELIKRQGQKFGQNISLAYLEAFHLTDSGYYLDKKLESIDTDYSVTSLEYYLENLCKVNNNTELKYLKLSSEIKGHIKRAMSIETELERVNESNNNNSKKLQEYVNALTTIYEQDTSAIEEKEKQQELVDKVVDLPVIRNSKVKGKSKIYK